MRRLLFISPHFPPDSTAGTHRARLLAPRLAQHGWEPTVLTVDAAGYEGVLDPDLAASVPATLRTVRVRAWPPQLTRRFGFGDLGVRAFEGLWREAAQLMAREPFDALFITIYPTYPALLGPLLKRRFNVPFVLDYQDPWVGEWGHSVGGAANGSADAKSRASRWAATRLEPIALGAADAVTAVSTATFEQALQRYRIPPPRAVAELPIGWDTRDFEFLDARPPSSPGVVPRGDGLVHMVYVGTLLPTGLETLRALFEGWAHWRASDAAASRVRMHFIGTSNQRSGGSARVTPIAQAYGLADLVNERPERIDYFDALQALRDASAVLLIGSREPHYTPSKVYPALLSGRPIFALNHAASTATALLRRVGGVANLKLIEYDDQRGVGTRVEEIARQLCALAAQPATGDAGFGREVIESASASALAGRLGGLLDEVVS